VNALREIETLDEIEVRLQTNEVLVHLPTDTPLGAIYQAIFEAGYAPDDSLWLTAKGDWVSEGFLPEGWSRPLTVEPVDKAEDGTFEFLFERSGEDWVLQSAEPSRAVPQVTDEDD
jgi:hypothetical protein